MPPGDGLPQAPPELVAETAWQLNKAVGVAAQRSVSGARGGVSGPGLRGATFGGPKSGGPKVGDLKLGQLVVLNDPGGARTVYRVTGFTGGGQHKRPTLTPVSGGKKKP